MTTTVDTARRRTPPASAEVREPRPSDAVYERALLVPVREPADAHRIATVVEMFSGTCELPVEFITVIGVDDDPQAYLDEYVEVVDRVSAASRQPVRAVVIVSESPAATVLERSRHRLVCMPTSASPFEHHHFVGSHAASLLADTSAPVILVGPSCDSGSAHMITDVVVPVSADPDSTAALAPGHDIAGALGLDVRVVHVGVNPDTMLVTADGEARLWFTDELHSSLKVDPVAADGADVGTALATALPNALMVLATHARHGLDWIAHGSDAFDAVAHAHGPVVLIGPEYATPANRPRPGTDREDPPAAVRHHWTPGHDARADARDVAAIEGGGVVEFVFQGREATETTADVAVVIDGTDRAAEAFGPALAIATARRSECRVVGVIPDATSAADARSAIEASVNAAGCGGARIDMVPRSELIGELAEMSAAGTTPVVSGFGQWTADSSLPDTVASLVREQTPLVIGVGPRVATEWTSRPDAPIVCCIEGTEPFGSALRSIKAVAARSHRPVILLHVAPPASVDDDTVARAAIALDRLAARIEDFVGVPASVAVVPGTRPSVEIIDFAQSTDPHLMMVMSRKRPTPDGVPHARVSLAVLAGVQCPVAIAAP